jgi:hypothetical protein
MKLLSLVVVAVVVLGTIVHARPSDSRAQLEATLIKLRDLQAIEPAAVAKLLDGKPSKTIDVTPARHETPLAVARFISAKVVVGGQNDAWRIVELVPDPALELTLADTAGALGKLEHQMEPLSPHGPPGTSHRYKGAKLDLVVDVDPRDRVTRIIATTERATWK